ncbi:MAG: hypothetical protein A3B99_00460 [Candidatus Yanofskybacteria bacterium RIFCSPHIGHO2_02_FULL_44_12b]|nr:MAG: hypothetical protein A2659_04465 [Candidatus Yanofskybacteria bacterium RIFCSPHIGHO2_01_FULL_44_24]OGN16077.1 MAG: hypothetical protein A3B99_00460 [Candidatus Yanofskybacteria bacterium RIFCSPHIGHO2_02_FULL_44_12b]OGN25148.1 MAG: hypothetical protein A2925_02835 [Candidatus Yanofskybacteria bacterium RIFCSPLOWO2_01_FULL_44_22]
MSKEFKKPNTPEESVEQHEEELRVRNLGEDIPDKTSEPQEPKIEGQTDTEKVIGQMTETLDSISRILNDLKAEEVLGTDLQDRFLEQRDALDTIEYKLGKLKERL